MAGKLKFRALLGMLGTQLAEVPEHRTGRNGHYEIADAGLAAFSVFFMQSPSFLAYQQDMERRCDQNNARSLFGVEQIPSDGQIRNLLDPLEPAGLGAPFWGVAACRCQAGVCGIGAGWRFGGVPGGGRHPLDLAGWHAVLLVPQAALCQLSGFYRVIQQYQTTVAPRSVHAPPRPPPCTA